MTTCQHIPATEAAIRTIGDRRAVDEAGCWFDTTAADKVVAFFERHLRLTIAGDRPFVLLPWQRDEFLRPLFGWRMPDGQRRFNRADLFVAKKNGKSTLAAGVALFGLMAGGDRAQVYGVAHTRKQASIVYDEAAAMARASTTINSRVKVRDSHSKILYPQTQSVYQALAGENNRRGVEGINPSLIIFDEIHVQRDKRLYEALKYASAARQNSLLLSISTVGEADPNSIWWEQYQYARNVLAGAITDHRRFALIYEADQACLHDPLIRRDPAQWRKANPSLGVAVTEESMRDAVVEAENNPAALGSLLRYRFNLPTAGADKVVRMDRWAECRTDIPDLTGRRCYGGLDLASTEDLAAFVLYFPPEDIGDVGWLVSRVWAPSHAVDERRRKGMAYYGGWVERGWLRETDGERIDHDHILEDIRDLLEPYDCQEIGFDKWNADAVIQPLMNDGYKCVAIPQTVNAMSNGTKALLDDIVRREIGYDGNGLLTWCFGNCASKVEGDALKFDKKRSPEKIDVAVAAAIARGRSLVGEEITTEPQIFF